ncbi:hypothetical protein TWF694_006611 [Orbilia ellipsospora]|uniref:Uncharacterized protein n=1 Tax=Orbilia ellipsospora TaxID=2528407 RepID=A0AAV9XM64_9PEZI
MESKSQSSSRTRQTKLLRDELLKDLFGEDDVQDMDLPSPYDRWINIQSVVRKVYREGLAKFDITSKRWTEIAPRRKLDMCEKVLSQLELHDRMILQNRLDVVEKMLKHHISNRIDWEKEKQRKEKRQSFQRPRARACLERDGVVWQVSEYTYPGYHSPMFSPGGSTVVSSPESQDSQVVSPVIKTMPMASPGLKTIPVVSPTMGTVPIASPTIKTIPMASPTIRTIPMISPTLKTVPMGPQEPPMPLPSLVREINIIEGTLPRRNLDGGLGIYGRDESEISIRSPVLSNHRVWKLDR